MQGPCSHHSAQLPERDLRGLLVHLHFIDEQIGAQRGVSDLSAIIKLVCDRRWAQIQSPWFYSNVLYTPEGFISFCVCTTDPMSLSLRDKVKLWFCTFNFTMGCQYQRMYFLFLRRKKNWCQKIYLYFLNISSLNVLDGWSCFLVGYLILDWFPFQLQEIFRKKNEKRETKGDEEKRAMLVRIMIVVSGGFSR